jgi:hypothetical protein
VRFGMATDFRLSLEARFEASDGPLFGVAEGPGPDGHGAVFAFTVP